MHVPTVTVERVPDPLPDGVFLLDVREPEEWAHGHIAGATHIPMRELPGRLDEVPAGQTIVVCRVGARSAQVVAWLSRHGHDAVNLDGGLVEWVDARRPLVSETGGPPHVV